MRHQFEIGVSGYTAFPRIGDPTPVRRLPPKVDPRRYYKRVIKDVPAQWLHKTEGLGWRYDPVGELGKAMEKYAERSGQTVFRATQTSPGHIMVDHLSPTGRRRPVEMHVDMAYGNKDQLLAYLRAHGQVETHVHDERLCTQMTEIERSHTAQRHRAQCQLAEKMYAKRQPSPQAEANAAADVCNDGRDHSWELAAGTLRRPGTR